jgi:ATP synthase protein I
MSNRKPKSASQLLAAKKKSVFLFIGLQSLLAIFVALGIFLLMGGLYAYSYLAGASAAIVPSIYMAWRVFGHAGTRAAKEVVRSFYRGEAGKLVLTALILAMMFIVIKPLSAGALLTGFAIAVLSHWLSPLFLKH